MQYMMNWMSLFWLFFVILRFWNFSRNRLATLHFVQVLGFLQRDRLAAHPCPPGDASGFTLIFMFFLLWMDYD